MITIQSAQELEQIITGNSVVLTYFSTTDCNVCKVLKPKVESMVHSNFPEIIMVYIETNQHPEIAAQNRVFAVPTLVVFFGGKEYIRKSRNFGLNELLNEIQRPYSLMFS